jgi:hypothetical protein
MKGRLDVGKTGLALGGAIAAWHMLWALLVAIGAAQVILDFVFWMHFIKPVYLVEPFEVGRAVVLIFATGVIGLASGAGFALIWNALHKPD